jgi:hypothetical protein
MLRNLDHVPPACRTRPGVQAASTKEPQPLQGSMPPVRLALNQREAAEALSVSAPTLARLDVPFIAVGSRKIYPIIAMQEWLREHALKLATKDPIEADADQPDAPETSGE